MGNCKGQARAAQHPTTAVISARWCAETTATPVVFSWTTRHSTLAKPCPSPSAKEVRALFQWLLGREARDTDVAERTGEGSSVAGLVADILGSAEHAEFASSPGVAPATPDEVRALYRGLLGRPARTDELELRAGTPVGVSVLARELLGSGEHAENAALIERQEQAAAPAARVNTWTPDLAEWHVPVGEQSADGVSVCGRDGFFFIRGGTNASLDHHLGRGDLPTDWSAAWRALVAERRDSAFQAGVRLSQLVVPDKLAVYEDRLPTRLDPVGPRPVRRLLDDGIPLHYPLDALQAGRAGGETYLRTDSHLSMRGNAILHDAVCRDLGFASPPDPLRDVRFELRLASGDLGSRYRPRVVEAMHRARRSPARLVAGNRAETRAANGHVGTYCTWENPDAPMRERVVVFGDSFAYGDAEYQGLAWLMAQCFAGVHFVWIPFGWDSAVVEEFDADLVVCEMAERFLVRVPKAEVSLAGITGPAEDAEERTINPESVFDA